MMFYYNQLDYKSVDYSKPNGGAATVASGGCGVCAALMVLNNLYGKEVMTVPQMAAFSKANGARTNYGTDMATLLGALVKQYAITYKMTSSNKELLAHLKAGGMAVINQGDVYNVFSNSGHFVAVTGIVQGETLRCLDPYWYDGKFAGEPRKSRIVGVSGKEVWVSLAQIGKCTQDRAPSYYLVSFTGKRNKPAVKKGQILTLKRGARLYNADSAGSGVMKMSDFTNFNVSAEALLKIGAKLGAAEVKTKANGNIWVKTKYGGWICVYDYKNDISKI